MKPPSTVVSVRPAISKLGAFGRTITQTKTGPLYKAGLVIVAFAMVLLPLIYLALIGLTAWLLVLHLIHDI